MASVWNPLNKKPIELIDRLTWAQEDNRAGHAEGKIVLLAREDAG